MCVAENFEVKFSRVKSHPKGAFIGERCLLETGHLFDHLRYSHLQRKLIGNMNDSVTHCRVSFILQHYSGVFPFSYN